MAKHLHIVRLDDGWAIKQENTPGYIVRGVDTQEQARQQARPLAQTIHCEVFTHRPNGQIRGRDSYGNDPFPPKG